jgi:hypothetical protein
LSQGWLEEYLHDICCSSVGLLNVSQAGLELASDSTGALLFSQCHMVWRSFVWASFWCFISAKYGSSISARFLIYGDHVVGFCTLVAILDPSPRDLEED